MAIKQEKRIINGEERDCFVYDIYLGGRRVRTPRDSYFPTIGECRAAIDAIRTDYRRGIYKFPADDKKIPIAELAVKASEALKLEGKSKGYVLRMEKSLKTLARVVPVTVSVRDLKTEHLEEFINHQIKLGIKHSTIRNKLNTIIVGLNMAVTLYPSLREWYPPRRPRKMLDPDHSRERVISPDEEKQIINALLMPVKRRNPFHNSLRVRNARVFWLALRTGMRSGEILGLEKSDVHFERGIQMKYGYIHVTRTLNKKTTKTKKARIIPMTRTINEALRLWIKDSKNEFVFPSPYYKESPVKVFRQTFKEAVIRAKLPYGRETANGIVFHDTRHTAATRLLDAGASIRDVADLLGHSDSFMTMRYVHSSPASKQKAMDLLDDFGDVHFETDFSGSEGNGQNIENRKSRLK
jgi:site-specific recombinase XerD